MRSKRMMILAGLFTAGLTACSKDDTNDTKDPAIRPITDNSSPYISVILDYQPAPGQFVNESVGTPAGAQQIIGGTSSLLHLGAFGGYVVFGFDHSILNKSGADLAIYGNPVKPPVELSEPGIVMVSQDVNGNGLPDDAWYELAGSEYNAATTIRGYKVTYYNPGGAKDVLWKDNQGGEGAVKVNAFHDHSYYPLFAANQDSITFEGTLLKSTFGLLPGTGTYVNTGFAWGYADNWATDMARDPYATKLYNSFDISWAVKANGEAVTLAAIDFVKVYTGQQDKGSADIGEVSTEIRGAADLNME